MKTTEQAKKDYKKNISNAKKIKKILEKSGLRTNILESVNFIIQNYKLDDEIKYGLYDFCSTNHISHLSGYDGIFAPIKITTFSESYLGLVKKWIESGNADERLTRRGKFDYSIHVDGKQARYSREYRYCGNGYYYLLLDYDTALFYEKD